MVRSTAVPCQRFDNLMQHWLGKHLRSTELPPPLFRLARGQVARAGLSVLGFAVRCQAKTLFGAFVGFLLGHGITAVGLSRMASTGSLSTWKAHEYKHPCEFGKEPASAHRSKPESEKRRLTGVGRPLHVCDGPPQGGELADELRRLQIAVYAFFPAGKFRRLCVKKHCMAAATRDN
jgi:hypothetical protein